MCLAGDTLCDFFSPIATNEDQFLYERKLQGGASSGC